jgi:hypothetical protein
MIIGFGVCVLVNAGIATWFDRAGIFSLSGRLKGADWADRNKVDQAADRGRAWQRRYAEISRKIIPMGVLAIVAGVVIAVVS